jgi:hypothetical protein
MRELRSKLKNGMNGILKPFKPLEDNYTLKPSLIRKDGKIDIRSVAIVPNNY